MKNTDAVSEKKLIVFLLVGFFLGHYIFPQPDLSMVISLVFIILALSLVYIPWRRGFLFWKTVKDVGIIVGINLCAIVIITIICLIRTGYYDPNYTVLLYSGIFCQVIGFTIAGILAQHNRLPHLSHVLIGIWLVNAIQFILPEFTLRHWFLSFFVGLVTMWIGYAISYLIRKPLTLTEPISVGDDPDDEDSSLRSE